ncbi:hypothetical protein EN781_00325 [Mesorhizobium sp. M4A.F.Ca.ET.090.04.2.1]|uniref:hypothetical protein n=1 Tax=Mesorhizobium sp. M4A.F.Ca.ET.090.04.2.1 TaxID=2496663 RepID=UPI000FCC4536|nr:hypothetical protein [Mesorhizobium sp. M4A.F.Ca.ET.090.04.2.1]RVC47616.1 hypothetical protein EN781_00325 [Mesorhizobium sp. M4A.F.Ca.ET.090.04.2.1]
MTKLFLDTPKELEKRIDRLVEHLRHAEFLFFNVSKHGLPSPRDLLWLLLSDAMETASNVPRDDLRMVSHVGTVMPGTRDTADLAYAREVARLQAGMPQYDRTSVKSVPSEQAIERMVDVFDLMRFVIAGRAGKDVLRMKRTVMARAAGLSLEQCGRIWDRHRIDFDRRAMHDLKQLVLGQILKGIEKQFGLVRTSRSFRRLTVREIEERKKARKREEARRRREKAEEQQEQANG